ncbi:MAG: DMT family transporter [Flavobacteriales bacterium]|nr:DMT family transporter [Flavobacteriales bacterium]
MENNPSPGVRQYSVFLLLGFIWGSSFILMKFGLVGLSGNPLFNAYQVAGLRIFIAGLVLLPFSIPQLKSIRKQSWIWLLGVGLFGNFIPAFLFANAIQSQLASSIAGILNSLTPLFALILGFLAFSQKVTTRQVIGLTIGLLGCIGLISLKNGSGTFLIWPAIQVVIAAMCYAVSLNIIKHKLPNLKSVAIASVALGMVAIPSGVFLCFANLPAVFAANAEALLGFGSIAVLAAVGTAFALVLFNKLLADTSVIFASSVTYIIPVFAALWGLVLDEPLTILHGVFGLVIILGVYIVNRKRRSVDNSK